MPRRRPSVSSSNTNGRKLLVSTNKYAKAILHNADKVEAGYIAPVGFTWK
jgi:hypothetical protein